MSRDYYASVFWSHQAIEKILKVVLIERSGELFRIHDLVMLSRMCKMPPEAQKKIKMLSGAYTEARYGLIGNRIPAEKFREKDAAEFLNIANGVLEWSKSEI